MEQLISETVSQEESLRGHSCLSLHAHAHVWLTSHIGRTACLHCCASVGGFTRSTIECLCIGLESHRQFETSLTNVGQKAIISMKLTPGIGGCSYCMPLCHLQAWVSATVGVCVPVSSPAHTSLSADACCVHVVNVCHEIDCAAFNPNCPAPHFGTDHAIQHLQLQCFLCQLQRFLWQCVSIC